MTISKSFVDLLFILLCATIVMLSQSLHIGAIDMAPVEVGSQGLLDINANDVRVVRVSNQQLQIDQDIFTDVEQLVCALSPTDCAVLVPANEDLSHHRMMKVWSAFRQAGVSVKIGAARISKGD